MDISVHASLHLSCHHQILYAKSKLKLNPPPPLPPDYMNGQFGTIKTLNCSIVQLKPSTGRNYLEIRMLMSSYTSSNNQIKTLIDKKNHLFKSYMANDRLVVDLVRLQKAGAEPTKIIKSSKESFYNNLARKLIDSSTSNKTSLSVMKAFINGKNPLLPQHY